MVVELLKKSRSGLPVEEMDNNSNGSENPTNGNGNGNGKKKLVQLPDVRLKNLMRHINHVQQSCFLLGERLALHGEEEIGHKLIANGFIHDNSKFHGIEWMYLHEDVKETDGAMFQAALLQHIKNNPHHPEYWDNISNMPRVYIAEMICDWHARSHEFGTDLRSFIKDTASKKFDFPLQGRVYKDIKYFVDILLDNSFV